MGMGSAPCHGFVRKADKKLLKFFGITKDTIKAEIEELGAGTDPELNPLEAITDLLQSGHGPELALKTGDGKEVRFFLYDGENGDRYDDLEDGQLYAIFSEDELWTKTPTAFLTKLKKAGLEPEECQWTNFG
jgi:hypothetical protein